MFVLPIVVIACLSVSLIESMILLPAHLNHLPDPNGDVSETDAKRRYNYFARSLGKIQRFISTGMERFMEGIYRPFLNLSLRWRYVSLCVALSILLLSLGLVRGGIIKYEMFPDIDDFIITSTLKFPCPSE